MYLLLFISALLCIIAIAIAWYADRLWSLSNTILVGLIPVKVEMNSGVVYYCFMYLRDFNSIRNRQTADNWVECYSSSRRVLKIEDISSVVLLDRKSVHRVLLFIKFPKLL